MKGSVRRIVLFSLAFCLGVFCSSTFGQDQGTTTASSPDPSLVFDGASSPTPVIPGSEYEDSDDQAYAEIDAPPSAEASLEPCETVTYPIFKDQLINLTEDDCSQDGIQRPYGRNSAFGLFWDDDTNTSCLVTSVTILIQAGLSCTGIQPGGQTTLNDYVTPIPYRFPYINEYNQQCICPPPVSPVQAFNLRPYSAYSQGSLNQFLIYNSTGNNGLRELVPRAKQSLYGLVIINQWRRSSNMNVQRSQFSYSVLGDGKVLAAGGATSNAVVTDTSEEYDPIAETWTLTSGKLSKARQLNQMVTLNDPGKPDVDGAYYAVDCGGYDQNNIVTGTTDVFNSSTQIWTNAPSMRSPRARHTLTSIFNGSRSAVAIGGIQGSLGESSAQASGELFLMGQNRSAWSWTPFLNNMTYARYRHQAVLVDPSAILVMGGQGSSGSALASAEWLNIKNRTFSLARPMNQARYAFTATRLDNGSILAVGGAQLPNTDTTWQNSQLLMSCELYTNGTWTPTSNLSYARAGHQAVLLDDGDVLVTGGGGTEAQNASEIWSYATGHWITVAPLPDSKINFGVARFQQSRVLAFGGSVNSTVTFQTGTTSSYVFTEPFTTDDLAPYIEVDGVAPSPAQQAAAPVSDSYRAPPVASSAPAAPINYNPSLDQIFADAPIPANASFQFNVNLPDELSSGAIGGIVGGSVGGALLIILGVIFFLVRRRKQRRAKRYSPEGLEKINNRYGSGSMGHKSAQTSEKSLGRANSSHSVHISNNALSSPFDGGSMTFPPIQGNNPGYYKGNGYTQPNKGASPQSVYPNEVVMPRGFAASPFSSEPVSLRSTKSGGGLQSLKSIEEGTATTLTGETAHTHGSTGMPMADTRNERSISSDLSRVSMQVRSELVAADWKIDRQALILEKRLGKGGFGEVFRGQHHGSPVAVKVLEINDERTMHDACQEFGHLHSLRHSKLVVSYGACIEENRMMLVMELMEEDLFHAIANDSTGSGDSVLWNFRGWQIAVDVASALTFLHARGLVHLDVKTLNILLRGRRTEAKLGDLGLARMIPDGHLALQATLPGTPAYSAPEVIQAQLSWRLRTQGRKDQFRTSVGTPADIFAFGVVLFEICTGQHPARWRQDFSGTFRPDQAPAGIAQLTDACLNDEPEERPTAKQVLEILLANKPRHIR